MRAATRMAETTRKVVQALLLIPLPLTPLPLPLLLQLMVLLMLLALLLVVPVVLLMVAVVLVVVLVMVAAETLILQHRQGLLCCGHPATPCPHAHPFLLPLILFLHTLTASTSFQPTPRSLALRSMLPRAWALVVHLATSVGSRTCTNAHKQVWPHTVTKAVPIDSRTPTCPIYMRPCKAVQQYIAAPIPTRTHSHADRLPMNCNTPLMPLAKHTARFEGVTHSLQGMLPPVPVCSCPPASSSTAQTRSQMPMLARCTAACQRTLQEHQSRATTTTPV